MQTSGKVSEMDETDLGVDSPAYRHHAFLSGCWNRRELNDLAIAVAAGVDWVDGRYRLTVQVANPGAHRQRVEVPKRRLHCLRQKGTLF